MALLTVDQNPTITDTVLFQIPCPGADGCFYADPYMVDSVTVYYLQVDVVNTDGDQEYDKEIYNPVFQAAYEAARKAACQNPSDENLTALEAARTQMEQNKTVARTYYSEAVPVLTLGTSDNPAWLAGDEKDALIEHLSVDGSGQPQYGQFAFQWQPTGMREGDYFLCWTWTPHPAGEKLTAHTPFTLFGNTAITTAIPTHRTAPGKYETLLEQYLPSMFKERQAPGDLTPYVIQGFNHAVARGFSLLEDMGAQIIDILDANATPEAVLPLLAGNFGIQLYSRDPALWRRQIKQAVANSKRRGTLRGLKESLSMAGINLLKFTQLWQVVSRVTWQESFVATDGQVEFTLARRAISPVNDDNFGVWLRRKSDADWSDASLDDAEFADGEKTTKLTWNGDELYAGDELRVTYQVADVTGDMQTVENYVRQLPLMDQRDERDQEHPPKNWNVRLVEEDDPWFDRVVPTRNPFHEPIQFGWIRTEFAYSENVYGMEEYDGSTRESTVPCDIGPNFMEPGHGCLSSCFNVDIEVSGLSDERIREAVEIINDNMPFHATLFSLNVSGYVQEFVPPPAESVECLADVDVESVVLSGTGQMVFNRSMDPGSLLTSADLTDSETVVQGAAATGYNEHVVLFSHHSPIDRTSHAENLLEVLSPSHNAGVYLVTPLDRQHAVVSDEWGFLRQSPLNESPFSFVLSALEYANNDASITQDDWFSLGDEDLGFGALTPGQKWWATFDGGTDRYPVSIEASDGTLSVYDPDQSLPKTPTRRTTAYAIVDENGDTAQTGNGTLQLHRRALVDVTSAAPGGSQAHMTDIRNLAGIGDYMTVGEQGGRRVAWYRVSGFLKGEPRKFYVADYDLGEAAGQVVKVYRRLVDKDTGSFGYKGLRLRTGENYEQSLNVQNGANPPSVPLEDNSFKENFIVQVGDSYYAIGAIDGETISLKGPPQRWPTLDAGGQQVTFNIVRYSTKAFSVSERDSPYQTAAHDFESYDRRGREFVVAQVQQDGAPDTSFVVSMLNNREGNVAERGSQNESVKVKIDWFDD